VGNTCHSQAYGKIVPVLHSFTYSRNSYRCCPRILVQIRCKPTRLNGSFSRLFIANTETNSQGSHSVTTRFPIWKEPNSEMYLLNMAIRLHSGPSGVPRCLSDSGCHRTLKPWSLLIAARANPLLAARKSCLTLSQRESINLSIKRSLSTDSPYRQ